MVIVDNEPWFVAADVCRALELGNPSQSISRLDDDEKVTLTTNEGHSGKLGGPQKMNIVSEAGLYSLILKSRKPEAKRFKRWITHEVIPTIRKTGGYVNDESTFIATYLPFADEGTKALCNNIRHDYRSGWRCNLYQGRRHCAGCYANDGANTCALWIRTLR